MTSRLVRDVTSYVDRCRRLGLTVPSLVRVTPDEADRVRAVTGIDVVDGRVGHVPVEVVDPVFLEIAGRYSFRVPPVG